ncbi:MAG TPA: clostripain-related cysteine peptidase, partial [Candidatus Syntrophosphaera sp.]|nr:clostripain-related cysteine peptidase [Candidatus Syntrophosphaera sp.]
MPLKPKFCLLLALLYCASLCAENWTVLVYMAADNNLWQNAALDVNDMESVDIPSNLKLVVQTDMPDSSPYPGGQRRLIRKDTYPQISSPVLADLGPIDSGDPQTLINFVNWGFQHYPSERKMLVIWGHGDNWFKADEPKWICPDDGSGSLISVCNGELRSALTGIPQLDILLFDACS